MNYGSILIVTDSWQTSTKVENYEEGYAYFSLFLHECRCNLRDPRCIEHKDNNKWQPFDGVPKLKHVFTPDIVIS